MKVLWVATKAPWPPVDGGRLLLWNTLRALHLAGVDVTLVAPYLVGPAGLEACTARLRDVCRPVLVPSRLRRAAVDLVRAELRRRPWTLVRHRSAEVRRRVETELDRHPFDVVVAEQVHALSQIPKVAETPPVVLRAQNVESDLWRGQSTLAGVSGPMRWWLRCQAQRLAAAEGEAVRRCAATAALTEHDAEALSRLARTVSAGDGSAPAPRLEVIPAVVDVELPAGPPLAGDPALVLFGSAGWRPNADGARSFLNEGWPGICRVLPGARLHVFGELPTAEASADATVRVHPAPDDSATALAEGSILVVPLDVASGVRMKILEAWARGVPVVASSAAARGLVAEPGRELEVVNSSDGWADAVARCVDHADALREAARRRLRETYSAEAGARRWTELLAELTRR